MEISYSRYRQIKDTINGCKKILGTTDPFKICELLGIIIRLVPLSSNMLGFADIRHVNADVLNFRNGQLRIFDATIFLSEVLTSYSRKITCAHELGHVLLQYDDDINLFDCVDASKDLKEYEANLFAIELMPHIYNNQTIDYRTLNKSELQHFMNRKVSYTFYTIGS